MKRLSFFSKMIFVVTLCGVIIVSCGGRGSGGNLSVLSTESALEIYQITDKELDKYLGVYSSNHKLPLKMTITKVNGKLFVQGTEQPFQLEATGQNKFKTKGADVVLEFNPIDKTVVYKHDDVEFTLAIES